jgi:hypothetical protein
MKEKRNSGGKGLIFGGLIILLSTLESETMIPWYIKIAGGLGLMIYGASLLIFKKDE